MSMKDIARAEYLRTMRKHYKLSIETMAMMIGIKPQDVQLYEHCEAKPDVRIYERYSEIFDMLEKEQDKRHKHP